MNLNELNEYIESVSLAHRDVKEFKTGSDYNQAEDINQSYPLVFYELPYLINYNIRGMNDNVQFAFHVLYSTQSDDIENDHEAISCAKKIGDEIVTYIMNNTTEFIVDTVTGLSLREFTDDSAAGMRYEWIIQLPREACDLNGIFDPL